MIAVLRAPGVAAILVAAFLTRVPTAMIGLALVLQVHGTTGSFATAGFVVAAFAFGLGLTAPFLGRTVDRHGATVVLVPGVLGSAASVVAVVLLGRAGAPAALLAAGALLAGACSPPTGGVVRRLWPVLLPGRSDLSPAYAIDALSLEALFIGGPLLVAALVTVASPEAALYAAAGCGVVGGLSLTALLARRAEPPRRVGGGIAGALAASGVRWIVVTAVPIGAMFGSFEVTLPAFGAAHGNASLGGPFNAALAVGSVAGGIAYGVLSASVGDRAALYGRLAVVQAVLTLPLLIGGSVGIMLAAAPLAGLAVAPQFAVRSELIGRVALPGTIAEASTWIGLAATSGSTVGTVLAGPLIDSSGWRAGAALAVAFAAATAVLARVSVPRLD